MIELNLRQEDAKLVYLAVAHHLGRPGSELDPITKQPIEHGLAEVSRALQPQLREQTAKISLNADQLTRLSSGMYGSMTELKAYGLLEMRDESEGGGRKSTVPGFDRTLRHLFPEVDHDVEHTMDIAERMMMLKRRLDTQLAMADEAAEKEQPAPPEKKGWWPFGRGR